MEVVFGFSSEVWDFEDLKISETNLEKPEIKNLIKKRKKFYFNPKGFNTQYRKYITNRIRKRNILIL